MIASVRLNVTSHASTSQQYKYTHPQLTTQLVNNTSSISTYN